MSSSNDVDDLGHQLMQPAMGPSLSRHRVNKEICSISFFLWLTTNRPYKSKTTVGQRCSSINMSCTHVWQQLPNMFKSRHNYCLQKERTKLKHWNDRLFRNKSTNQTHGSCVFSHNRLRKSIVSNGSTLATNQTISKDTTNTAFIILRYMPDWKVPPQKAACSSHKKCKSA